MKVETITCPECGAPIQVPLDSDIVTCSYCGSKVKLERPDNDRVVAHLREVENDNALMRLDQDWEAQSEQYMIRTRNGELTEPEPFSLTRIIRLLAIAGVLGAIWAFSPWTLSASVSASCFLAILIIMIMASVLLWNAKGDNEKYRAYKAAEDAYQARRQALIKERTGD